MWVIEATFFTRPADRSSRSRAFFITVIKVTKWLFTRYPIKKMLGLVSCVQITAHLKCIRLVHVRSSLPIFAMACE